jgi:hypothetical protein
MWLYFKRLHLEQILLQIGKQIYLPSKQKMTEIFAKTEEFQERKDIILVSSIYDCSKLCFSKQCSKILVSKLCLKTRIYYFVCNVQLKFPFNKMSTKLSIPSGDSKYYFMMLQIISAECQDRIFLLENASLHRYNGLVVG